MTDPDIKIEKSVRGKDVLLIEGHQFYVNKKDNNKYYWCCAQKGTKQCRSTLMTTFSSEQGHSISKPMSEHSHSPEAATSDVISLRNRLKRDASTSFAAPTQLIHNNLAQVPSTSACSVPNKNALRQIIRRARKKSIPVEPRTLAEINIPDEMKVRSLLFLAIHIEIWASLSWYFLIMHGFILDTEFTLLLLIIMFTFLFQVVEGEPFLARDVTYGENKRLIIFCTRKNMEILHESTTWIMDGTFQSCPSLFTQIYTIHAYVGNDSKSRRTVPVVYCLLCNKAEETYMTLFKELKSFALEHEIILNPQHIVTDFEIAVINVIKIEFPESTHNGCFFHLGQNIWRKIQSCQLAAKYGKESDFALKLRHIAALAYLPPEEIPDAFTSIKDNVLPEEAERVIEWFETYYVYGKISSRSKGNNVCVTKRAPLFPPSLWSVHRSNTLYLPRTQNKVEAWHRRWNGLLSKTHFGLYTTITFFQKEQMTSNHIIEKVRASVEGTPPRKKCTRKSHAIQKICDNKDNLDTLQFLRAIANHIEF